jgi:hypothetical protein
VATTAEVQFLLTARNAAGSVFAGVERQLQGIGRSAEQLSKRFSGGQLLGSILGGVGLGSGAQITQKLVELVQRPWEKAAEAAKRIEGFSKESADHTARMLELRRKMLGITVQEKTVGQLELEARVARAAADDAGRQRFEHEGTFFGGATGRLLQRDRTPEEDEEFIRLARAAREAEKRLAEARVSSIEEAQAEVVANVTAFEKTLRDQLDRASTAAEQGRRSRAQIASGSRALDAGELEQVNREFGQIIEAYWSQQARAFEQSFGEQFGRRRERPSYLEAVRDRVRNNPDAMTAGDGVEAGALGFLANVGSIGEQVAGTIQTTLGTAVRGISDLIYGWATGAKNFGDVLRGIGSSVLQQVLDTLVQIGVQQVVNGNAAKAIAVGWKALTSTLRAADTAETIAAESAKAPVLAANAAAASASSFGLSAVIGIAALAAALGAFVAGFEDGGFTGPGDRSKVAGVVHGGEYVFSAPSVQALGLERLESLHRAGRGYAQGGYVGDLGSRLAGRGRSSSPQINLIAVDGRREAETIRKNSRGEVQIFDLIKRRRHELLG